MAAVKAGMGREEAHSAIKGHAVAAARHLREETDGENLFLTAVAADVSIPLDESTISAALGDPASFTGRAAGQVDGFVDRVGRLADRYPEAAAYAPAAIL